MNDGKVLLCTTDNLDGYRIEIYYGLVSAHVATGVNALRGWITAVRDIIGGRSGSYEKELAHLEERAVEELIEKAAGMGANAILGLRWDYSYVGGDRRSLLMLAVTGTACKVGESVDVKREGYP